MHLDPFIVLGSAVVGLLVGLTAAETRVAALLGSGLGFDSALLQFIERNVGRKLQRPKTKCHRVSQSHHAAQYRPRHPLMLF